MRELFLSVWILCGLLVGVAQAETYRLADNQVLIGDLSSPDEHGAVINLGDNKYSERIPWAKFSQDDLKKIGQNPKARPFVEPFIELTPEEKVQRKAIPPPKDPVRLERPPPQSLIGGMFSSSLGLVLLLLLYAANLYAAYEVSLFRSQPAGLVCGIAAVAPVIGPIVFLSMPTRVTKTDAEVLEIPPEAPVPVETATAVAEEPAPGSQTATSGLSLAARPTEPAAAAVPEAQIFQRGQFTFNRRFLETKFPGFFGVVRRDAERDMVLLVKSARGTYAVQRITRISANEVHLQVQKGGASEEVLVPFLEIQEIQLKHKSA